MATSSSSLIVCGPQIDIPDTNYLSHLRSILIHDPNLRTLRQEAIELTELWSLLVAREPSLSRVAASPALRGLAEWITNGDVTALRVAERTSRNMLLAVLTVLAHILEYAANLNHGDDNSGDVHVKRLEDVCGGGIQGLCIGILSATALASSRTRAEVAKNGAIALRLALCVGACIDHDETQSQEQTICLTARWSSSHREQAFMKVFNSFPQVCPFSFVLKHD